MCRSLITVFHAIWGRNFTLMCYPNTLRYRWSICAYVHSWNGVASCWLWANRQYVFVYWRVCDWIRRCYSCSMQYEAVISPWCVARIHYNGDGGTARVCWMYGTGSCWPSWCALQIHWNADGGCAIMILECMIRCRVVPGQTGSTFVLVYAWICSIAVTRAWYNMRSWSHIDVCVLSK